MQCVCSLSASSFSRTYILTIGLIDHDDVGHLHQAALDPLQFISCPSERDEDQDIDHLADGSFGLPNPHRFDENVSVACRLTKKNCVARVGCDSAVGTTRWGGTDEGHLAGREKVHARLVAENASPAELTAGVHGEYGDVLTAFVNETPSESFDETTFARSGNSGHSHPDGISPGRQAFLEDLVGDLAVSGTRAFNQRDGACQHGAIPSDDAFDAKRWGNPQVTFRRIEWARRRPRLGASGLNVQRALLCMNQSMLSHKSAVENVKHLLRGDRNHSAWTIDAGDTGVVQKVVILRRNNTANHHSDVFTA